MEVLGLEAALGSVQSETLCPLSRHQKRRADPGSREGSNLLHRTLRRVEKVRGIVFPADWGHGHFVGVVRVLNRLCVKAKLSDVTPHVLRHTFASVAGDLGFSELTIAGLLGHSARGVTQGYVHLDSALVVAADRVSERIAELLDDVASGKHGNEALQRRNAVVLAG